MPRLKAHKYRVVGQNAVAGHAPGATFTAAYSAEHEQYLITAGHVERVAGEQPSHEKEQH